MSNIYIQEPPTSAKVLLTTSCGEIDMELWAKETPKACRNFIQLCMEGYYNNTIFHRIVKGFCIQGGDPTGTGSGGESIYGHPFKDEVHQRLRFTRRGLVAMANAGPNDNQSQFFFTLDRADELNKKHTIFGKVTGNTIYNMLKMENCEVDKDDRPLFPPKIIKTEILSNPFDDIEPRENKVEEKSAEAEKEPKSQGTKNFQLLSFGDEAEDDETDAVVVDKSLKMKSSHDLLDDPKLSSQPAVEQMGSIKEKTKSRKRESDEGSDDDDDDDSEKEYDERMREQVRQKLKKQKADKGGSHSPDDSEMSQRSDRSKELRKESKMLKRELMESKRKNEAEEEEQKHNKKEASDSSEVLTDFHAEQKLYLAKKKKEQRRKGDGRDAQTISLLADFQSKLEQFAAEQESEELEKVEDEELEEEDDTGWMSHILSCEEARARQAKDASIQDANTYEIFDPRNPINKRRREASKQSMKTKR